MLLCLLVTGWSFRWSLRKGRNIEGADDGFRESVDQERRDCNLCNGVVDVDERGFGFVWLDIKNIEVARLVEDARLGRRFRASFSREVGSKLSVWV